MARRDFLPVEVRGCTTGERESEWRRSHETVGTILVSSKQASHMNPAVSKTSALPLLAAPEHID